MNTQIFHLNEHFNSTKDIKFAKRTNKVPYNINKKTIIFGLNSYLGCPYTLDFEEHAHKGNTHLFRAVMEAALQCRQQFFHEWMA